jgi:hypothetical protein
MPGIKYSNVNSMVRVQEDKSTEVDKHVCMHKHTYNSYMIKQHFKSIENSNYSVIEGQLVKIYKLKFTPTSSKSYRWKAACTSCSF